MIAEDRAASDPAALAEEMAQSGIADGERGGSRRADQDGSPEREPRGTRNARSDEHPDRHPPRPSGDPPPDARPSQHARPLGRRRAGQRPGAADPGATFVEFPIDGHITPAADMPPVVDGIERFLSDAWDTAGAAQEPDRVLATVMFTDIVGSTESGASGRRAMARAARAPPCLVRRELSEHGQRGQHGRRRLPRRLRRPARAIRCACAITEEVKELGFEVRAGLHTGECEVSTKRWRGIACTSAPASPPKPTLERCSSQAPSGTSSRAPGSPSQDRGAHELSGIPGEWHLYTVVN